MTRTALLVMMLLGCTTSEEPAADMAGSDSGVVLDGAGGGGDSASDRRINPVEAGRVWEYAVAAVGAGYMTCPAGTGKVTAAQPMMAGGRTAIATTSFCSGVPSIPVVVTGDKTEVYVNGTWATWLDTPVEGQRWTYFNSSWTWQRSPAVTVPAGTFEDCWRAVQVVNYTSENVYCRGVGLVRSQLKDLAGNGWDAKLTKKSF